MPEPVIYRALDAALEADAKTVGSGKPIQTVEHRDPLWEWERILRFAQKNADLASWKLKPHAEKLAYVRGERLERRQDEGDEEFHGRAVRWWRTLSFIIAEEARSGGSREVALAALNLLFPMPDKPEKKG